MSCPKPSVRSPKAFSYDRPRGVAFCGSSCSCRWPQRSRKRQLMPIRIEQMEIPFAPGSILRLFRLESQLVEASPERVHIRHMEDEPTPAVNRLTLLQIEDGRVRVFRTQGREPRSSSAVEHLHAEHIPIELHGGLHVRDSKRDRRNPLNFHRHAGSLLPPERAALASLIFA